jgi:hypothetical protein
VISATGSPEDVLQAALSALATRAAAANADGSSGTAVDAAASVNFAALPPNAFAVSTRTLYNCAL